MIRKNASRTVLSLFVPVEIAGAAVATGLVATLVPAGCDDGSDEPDLIALCR